MFLKLLFWILIFFIFLFVLFSFVYRDFLKSSLYGSMGVWGKIGTGKTTLIQKFNKSYYENGWKCFSNIDMRNCQRLPEKFWLYKFPENSLLQIDEASFDFLNRDWKNTPKEFIKFLKGARHDHIKIIFYSQTADLDIQIRQACDTMFLLKKIWLFSIARAIQIQPTILNNGSVGNPDLKGKGTGFGDMYSFVPILVRGSVIITFLPRWSGYYDSFEELIDNREVIDYKLLDASPVEYTKKWYRDYKRAYWSHSFHSFFDGLKKRLFALKNMRSNKIKKSIEKEYKDDEFFKLD